MPASVDFPALRERHDAASAKIRTAFEKTNDGPTALLERTALVDSLVVELYRAFLSPDATEPEGACVVAIGGYGRRELFPHSDVDLLFLCADGRAGLLPRDATAAMCRHLWDLRLRLSPSTREISECDELNRDNFEFTIALLDCRLVAGDAQLFARLRNTLLPRLVIRERTELVRGIDALTRQRYAKHGNTVFRLEPNVKDAPGGLRDLHVAGWLAQVAEVERSRSWRMREELWASPLREDCLRAFDFLAAARCFLHYRQGRDDNLLTYELQAEAAARRIGVPGSGESSAADWMREYFRHARAIHRLTAQLLDEVPPARSSLLSMFEDWRSRLSTDNFSVLRERIFIRRPESLVDPALLLELLEFMARHGLRLSGEAERAVERVLPAGAEIAARSTDLWRLFRAVLVQPHAADALRAAHRMGLLVILFPELRAIDSLVIRDFYHRYTVDEHSFLAIENIHRLRQPQNDWERKYQEIVEDLDQPELLFLAVLLHDIGKGMPAENHIDGSLQAVESVIARLGLQPVEGDTVRFLVANHLEMSAALRGRDIFDPLTIRALADHVGYPQRLKMLCLFTYADIQSVNPEALTPWKAEMLWQLYVATLNHLNRSVDDERFHAAGPRQPQVERVLTLLEGEATRPELDAFLEGFPQRYFVTHSAEEIATHFRLARKLREAPVQLRLQHQRHHYDLTILTADRPFLFATIAGVLASWGMNIVRAEAFSSQAGVVLDTFEFTDLYRTLELNPSEIERFQSSLVEVLEGKTDLQTLLRGRIRAHASRPLKVRVETNLVFDNESATHSTLLELVAPDFPGLLHRIGSVLSQHGCNIEVALIGTEGPKAIDVFYLTVKGRKLDSELQRALRDALLSELESGRSA